MKRIIVDFEKIGENGVSIGRFNGKIVFSYGIIPGERAKIIITKEKNNFIEGELEEVIISSPYRINPKESHYLSCSPWQTFDYKLQIELKKNLLKEIFFKFSKYEIDINHFYPASQIFEYRTKIEYSFLEEKNKYFFAFYKRGSFNKKIKLKEGCLLIDREVNNIALDILDQINKKKIKNLKSLIIRKTRRTKDCHFALLTTNKNQSFIYKNDKISGFALIFSNPQTSISSFDEVINFYGREYLKETILNLEINYPYNSFFQNNIELFEEALRVMIKDSEFFSKIVDLYSGVGVIGLSLKDKSKKILAIDIDNQAIFYAKLNAKLNKVKNFQAICLASEKIPLEILENTDLLILDPPRPGLHPKLIDLIIKTKPYNIFYLSCNPITQARDFNLLKDNYRLKEIYAFDFYPNTPHLECLIFLRLK
ncbi:MAG: 23S rRNA (uracil-5-)-methyltransferase RumA [Candidatus Parcubacteria bacterium]|nr:MAG: 23S rRNA (uracil-5-)-methyltransferase RumA [Candidatus Parcubacteria bacterium]